jgi:hypothetical protein
MATPLSIPQVTYNSYFGNVGKVVWFQISENVNYFQLHFSLYLQQARKTNLLLYSDKEGQYIWDGEFPADVDQQQYNDIIRILNLQQTLLGNAYAVINNPTP